MSSSESWSSFRKWLSAAGSPAFLTALAFLVFAVIFCLTSLVNHYLFRTYAADLGIFHHALYSFSRFRPDYLTLHLWAENPSFLGDHFSPLVMLLVPFYWFFGSWGLLLLQILAILFAGWGIYLLVRLRSGLTWLPLLITIHFFILWGINGALAFDFHTNVVAACLVPWLVLTYFKDRRFGFLLFFLLIILAKEIMSVWLGFILAGLMLMRRKTFKDYLKFEIPLMLLSFAYFYLVVSWVMPAFRQGIGTDQIARYHHLGNDIPEILGALFSRPAVLFELLFTNISGDPLFDGVKGEFHWMVLVSGGLAFLLRPAWLAMTIPLYGWKFLSQDTGLWGINVQYSVEFAPLLSMAVADAVMMIRGKRWIYLVCAAQLLLTGYFSYAKLENRKNQWWDRPNYRFYAAEHYRTELDIPAVRAILRSIPPEKSLSVSSSLAPHLAFREKIYSFPVIRDAEMIVVFKHDRGNYPLTQEQKLQFVGELIDSGRFKQILDRDSILILKRFVQ